MLRGWKKPRFADDDSSDVIGKDISKKTQELHLIVSHALLVLLTVIRIHKIVFVVNKSIMAPHISSETVADQQYISGRHQ